jgi:RNA polymerase sigma factor (sigma-70 family)
MRLIPVLDSTHPEGPDPMSDDRPVTDLVTRARNGDQRAWDDLVERYAPLVWSICRMHQLSDADAGDVHQNIWLQLARQPDRIRDPAALADWLATATWRECIRARNAAPGPHARGRVPDLGGIADQQGGMAEQELLAAERHAALREALARLPPCCQQLIAMLLQDPPVTDAQISASLNIPAGSIGPRCSRCLDKLRCDPVIAALINAEAAPAETEPSGQAPTR